MLTITCYTAARTPQSEPSILSCLATVRAVKGAPPPFFFKVTPMAATSSAPSLIGTGCPSVPLCHPSSRVVSEEDRGGSDRRGLRHRPQSIEEVLVPPLCGMQDPFSALTQK